MQDHRHLPSVVFFGLRLVGQLKRARSGMRMERDSVLGGWQGERKELELEREEKTERRGGGSVDMTSLDWGRYVSVNLNNIMRQP